MWNKLLFHLYTVITVYLYQAEGYNCRYNFPNVLRPGPKLSVDCRDTTALVTWDVTELNVDLEAVYVEYNCSSINPTNTTEENTAEVAGPVYEVYAAAQVSSSSSTIVPIQEDYSCSYFGCARHSREQTWYTFNTVNCISPTSLALLSTTSNGMSSTVHQISPSPKGTTGTASSTARGVVLSPTKGISTPFNSAMSTSEPLSSAIPTNTAATTASEIPPKPSSVAWLVPLVVVMTLSVAALLILLLICVITRRIDRRRILLHKYTIDIRQDIVDLDYFPVQPDLMEKISIVSEYSVFEKLYASELHLPTTNEDEISPVSFVLKTHPTDMCSSHSEQVGMHRDTSGGTDGYMEIDSDPKADISDLIATEKCCNSESKLVESASIPSDLENTLAEDFKCRQMPDCSSIEQAEDEPQNIEIDCLSSPRRGYILCKQENMPDNDGVLDDMLSPEDNVDIWDIESGSVSGESFVEVTEDDII